MVLADGNTILWNENNNIYAMDIDGSNQRTVLDDISIDSASNYHPVDEKKFIMRSDRLDGNMHFFEMNADGSGIISLTDGPYNDVSATYSPDGKYLCYLRLPDDFDTSSSSQPYPYELVIKKL
jgi:Tol biopolymer transport system component